MIGMAGCTALVDLENRRIVRRVLAGETALFEIIMRRYNQRLFRAARGVLTSVDTQNRPLMDT